MQDPARRAVAAGVCGTALALALASSAGARESGPAPGGIDRTFTAQAVTTLAETVEREYFDAAVAARVGRVLRNGLAGGRYDQATALDALAEALTRDMRAETTDKHLAVLVVRPPETAPSLAAPDDGDRALRGRRDNFGVRRVEILAGNVGYLDLTWFYRLEEAREAITSAMRTLRNADALIVDLRENGGGSPGSVALFASFLFDEPGLPLFEVVGRSGERSAYATEKEPASGRDGARPVYALTAAGTFSAGEGMAFLLQERHRAEVIGERTAGAANPGRSYPLNDRLEAIVPNGRVVMAVTGRNWEGAGVAPDVPAPAVDALRVAHARAVRELLKRPTGVAWRQTLQDALDRLEAAAR